MVMVESRCAGAGIILRLAKWLWDDSIVMAPRIQVWELTAVLL